MLKMGKRLFLTLAIFASLLVIVSCKDSGVRIKIEQSKYELHVNDTIDVAIDVTKDGVAYQTGLGYKSFDESIATFVDGKLTGVSEGTTQIKVYSLENPLYDAVASVSVSFSQSLQADFKYSTEMYKGDKQTIKYTLAPDSEDALVTYKSSDIKVLSVDRDGNVLGLSYGTADVIARVTNSSDPKQYREFALTITIEGTKWNIAYNLAGGNAEELPDSYVEGTGVELPSASKDGYNFLGWLNKTTLIDKVSSTMSGNLELVASWEIVKYAITFESNGGSLENAPVEYTIEDEILLPTPVKAGYDFVGWYDNAELDGEVVKTITKGNSGDKAYFAKWELEKYDVNLDLDGGKLENGVTSLKLNKEEALPVPTKLGYNFLGWFEGENKVTNVSKDSNLKAHWEIEKYDVVLDLNGGRLVVEGGYNSIAEFAADFMADWKATGASVPTMSNFCKETSSSIKTAFANEAMLEKYVWLYKLAKETINAQVDANNSNLALLNVMLDRMIAKDVTAINVGDGGVGRTTFRFWLHSLLNEKMITESEVSSGQYGPYSKFAVDFSKAENQAKFWNAYYDTKLELTINDTLPVAVRDYHNFIGWFKGDEKVEHVSSDCTLIAKWEPYKYTISYNLDGGKWGEEEGVSEFSHNQFPTLVDPIKEGYKFLGWILNNEYVSEINKNEAYTLTAKWKSNDATGYEVIFDLDGGTFEGKYTSIAEFAADFMADWKATGASIPTMSNFCKESSSSIKTAFANEAMLEKYVWLYKFAKETINAQVDSSNSDLALLNAMLDRMIAKDVTAINVGDGGVGRTTFRFWLHSLLNEKMITESEVSSGQYGPYSKFAVDFSKAENQAKFMKVAGVSLHQTIEPDQKLPVPVKENYVFLGWYIADEKIDVVKDDCILTAKWIHEDEVEYEVSFILNGGSLGTGATTIAEFAAEFLADWKATGASVPALNDFNKSTSATIKTAFGNAEMLKKYQWLIQLAKETINVQVDASDENLKLINAMFDMMIAGDTAGISVNDGGVGRTAFRYWLHSLLNGKLITVDETSGSTQYDIYSAYAVDFSKEENLTKLWNAYNALLVNIYTPKDELPTPKYDGHLFLGWFKGDEKVEYVRGNWTLEAKWARYEDVKYSINYDLAGGSWADVEGIKEFHHNQEVTLIIPVREGYTFEGWFEGENVVTSLENRSYSLVATWKLIPVEEYKPVDRIVDPSNPDAYKTIEEALLAAKPGDTIRLVAGEYPTIKVVTENITIAGPNAGINPNKEARLPEAIFKSDIVIAADNVTIDGIYLTNLGRIVGDTKGVKNPTIKNVYSHKAELNPDSGYSFNAPIVFFTGEQNAVFENIVLDNLRYDETLEKRSMVFYGAQINGLTITDSVFIGVRSNYNDAIKINKSTEAGHPSNWGLKGEVLISGNHFENYAQYVMWFREYAEGNYQIINNTVKNCGQTAGSHGAVSFIDYTGEATGKVNIEVKYNTVENSYSLFRLDADSALTKENAIVKVNYNKLMDSAATKYIDNRNSFKIDATNNWYDVSPNDALIGNAEYKPFYEKESDVPGYVDLNNTLAINYELNGGILPEGSATRYNPADGLGKLPIPSKDNSIFMGWLMNGEIVDSLPKGLEEVKLIAKWREDALYVGVGEDYYYATISEALAAAKDGDKIIILAGTYAEDITINLANLTIVGPNENINPNYGTRFDEAILKGKITINASASNLKLQGLAFTENATISGKQVLGLTFQNNYVYDTVNAANAWVESNSYPYGFIYFAGTAAAPSQYLQFYNNKFENVSDTNIGIASVKHATFEGNVFHNFDRDAIRFNGGANFGVLSFTNNEFIQDQLAGYNGIYFRIYGYTDNTIPTNVIIDNNKFVKIGTTGQMYSNAISARNYNEYGASFLLTNNYFEACHNYIRIRNNAIATNHAANQWSCKVENNQFIGLPSEYYFAVWNASDTDPAKNPISTVFGANYYVDNSGKLITDLSTHSTMFKQVANIGTALSAEPGSAESKPVEFYTITYHLDGGVAKGTFITNYSNLNDSPIAIPSPEKTNHQFLGWNLNGKLVTEIPSDTRGNLDLVAEYAVLEGEIYSVTFVDEKGYGTWPTRAADDQYEIANLLLADIYEWQVASKGVTTEFEQWKTSFIASLKTGANESMRNPDFKALVDESGNDQFFINIPKYNKKWVEFFKLLDKAMLGVSATQSFWTDSYAGHMRLGQFLDWSKPDYYNSLLTQMRDAVRVPEEKLTQYQGGQIISLPVLTSEIGLGFLGWYENADFSGSSVESIVATDTGDKIYYARWEGEIIATKVELNIIESMTRYSTHQLVWTFNPVNTTNQKVEFLSSNESIASVGLTSGLITAHTNGEVKITMKVYGNRELDATFTVVVYSPEHLTGSYDSNSLVVKNETIKLNAVNPSNSNEVITWSSSNADIAYVDATSGVVTGIKAGVATITATSKDSKGNVITLDFIVSVVDEKLTGIAEYIVSQNEANIFTRYDLYVDGNSPFSRDIFGSVNKVLFNEKLNIDRSYQETGDANGKHYGEKASTEFIVVHYTANNNADGLAHAKYFSTAPDTSIHYATGNDGVYQVLSDNLAGWHAGDSDAINRVGEFEWLSTGVAYDGTPLLEVKFSATDDFRFEINGKATSIKLPATYDYVNSKGVHRYGDHIYNTDGTISSQPKYTGTAFSGRTPESFFNDQGFPVTVINGEYYMGKTWWCYTQTTEGRICATGGNRNGIGIESSVASWTDLWYTWQKTAQLVAQLMVENDLDISRVKGHHFFSGKNCPQPMLQNDQEIWHEFIKLVQAEHKMITEYKDCEITFVSNNPELVNEHGRVIKQPDLPTSVSYTLTIKDASGNTQTITLASMIQGIYQK